MDHGKTSLIRALTGKNTDRLKEEQQRGITIELGFADMTAPDGTDIGIIDVPGHEKFIKNMLAGIGGIDLVLLVVAADEGVLPQTVEHLDIMRLLNIKRGIIVITKADMVDDDWMDMVEADVREACKGSFLENAEAVRVSSVTGMGIEELREKVFAMIKQVEGKNNNASLLRIPIDRVFTIAGFGTVITGTLTQGMIKQGQEVQIYPSGIEARVRNIQVHNVMVDAAYAGQRTAVNLGGIKKEDISRGNVLAAKDSLHPGTLADVKLNVLSDSKRVIESGSKLHFYYGSAETLCKAVLLDKPYLQAGESCYAQLIFDEEVVLKQDDPFVVRYFSPLETIGGGVVLDANPRKHKRSDTKVTEALAIREKGDDSAVLEQALKDGSSAFTAIDALAKQVGMSEEQAYELMMTMLGRGKAVQLAEKIFVHSDYIKICTDNALAVLREYHSKNQLTPGMPLEEFRSKFGSKSKIKDARRLESVMDVMAASGQVELGGNTIKDAEFSVNYTKAQRKLMDELYAYYKQCGAEAPENDAVLAGCQNKNEARQLLYALAAEGRITKIASNVFIEAQVLSEALDWMKDYILKNGGIALAEFRDHLGTSRKYALQILDYCDAQKITRLEGEKRYLF